jgi:hypothetical protein
MRVDSTSVKEDTWTCGKRGREIYGACRTNERDKTNGPMMLKGKIIQVDMRHM